MKILVTGMVPAKGIEALYKYFEVTYQKETPFTREEVLRMLPEYDGVLLANMAGDKELIDAGSKLKIIAVNGAGFDAVDIEYARNKGIPVANCPMAVMESAAEMTIALMLAITRRVSEYDRALRQGTWLNVSKQENMGHCLFNSTLGVFGLGRIGKAVVKRAQAFGMKVIYYNSFKLSPEEEQALGVEFVSFEELLEKSDVITIHTPLTDQTYHCFSEAQFAKMKPTAYVINAARGSIIDERALVKALESGTIRGAGLDVFENEPEVSNRLLTLNNVVMTPHAGTGCLTARTQISMEASDNIISLLCHNVSKNVVNGR